MAFHAWLSIVGVCLLGAMSPGPSLAVVMRNTVRGSRQQGIITGVAHACGVGGYALLTVSGLAALFAVQPTLQHVLAWGGALYLAWLGYKALRSKGAAVVEEGGAESVSLLAAARDGLFISALNPKLALFFLALFSQFVSPQLSFSAAAIMVLTAAVIDGGWYSLVAILISRQGILTFLQRHARRIDRMTGILFLFLALRVVTL